MDLPKHWHKALDNRHRLGNYRSLKQPEYRTDFLSNDYLGMARNPDFQESLWKTVENDPGLLTGSTGSRLISGNSLHTIHTEEYIAHIHQTESALLFPSGYKANLALFSCIAGRYDTLLVDELVHRSVHDGCALSHARKKKFRHNDLLHLEYQLNRTTGNVFIAVESLYSMDGDFAPLKEIVALAEKYGAWVIVDEAHAAGVFNKGLVSEYRLQNRILASIITYGKAFGLQGAAVLGSNILKDYLINVASPFIYSTAMPDIQVLAIREAYEFLNNREDLQRDLQENILCFRQHRVHSLSQDKSPVQVVQFSSTANLFRSVQELKHHNINAYPVMSPTVKAGSERLRIAIHQFNTTEEINRLVNIIKKHQNEY
ncbi:aminotransferase class I/II-fold pyridoxal phosphate-dependent enzyme [Elizabethkingia meningoseptica]|uniref:aminotransferase class I/II-fold pyridoxal phosphate-dependent enzyme n=1 Tax=Elizabethkingia meningoseptica TaxID=238 RepID=UPI003891656B